MLNPNVEIKSVGLSTTEQPEHRAFIHLLLYFGSFHLSASDNCFATLFYFTIMWRSVALAFNACDQEGVKQL